MKLTEQVRLAQGGDGEARTALYQAMYKRVYYLALRMTERPEDAEDAVQETFLAAFRALPGLADPNAFEGWLFQIAANKCRTLLRREGKYTQLPENEDGETLLDELPEENEALIPASALDSEDGRAILLSIIRALPEQQRECVLLFYYAQLSVKQIAQTMGCSEGTVKSRLNYARKKLRESILETEQRDGIRLHSLAPLGLLFLRDMDTVTAPLGAAALGGTAAAASGTAASGTAASGTAASGTAKAGFLATVKAKVIAGVTAAALAAGGGAVLLSQPRALIFSDPAMEQNLRVILDKPEGALKAGDLEELYALYLFEDGMAGDMGQGEPRPQAGTVPVSSLADLAQLPALTGLYCVLDDPALLDTLEPMPELAALAVSGAGLSRLDFLEQLPGLTSLTVTVAGGADLGPVAGCGQLQRLDVASAGGLVLPADGLEQLRELNLIADREGAAPESPCALQVSGPLPRLLMLRMNGGTLPDLSLLEHTPALQVLELYGTNLGGLDLTPVGGLAQLRAVLLTAGHDGTLDLAPLSACPALEVCLVTNGAAVNPPPQAAGAGADLTAYNQVVQEVYDQVFAAMDEA